MRDDDVSIFSNLPRRKRRLDPDGYDDEDANRRRIRSELGMRNFEEGPLPPRPHRSGKGGPSINQGAAGVVSSVWSASDAAANAMTLSNGGLTVAPTSGVPWQSVRGSISKSSGKLYFEVIANVGDADSGIGLGLANAGFTVNTYLGNAPYSFASYFLPGQYGSGFTAIYGFPGVSAVTGTVLGVAIDFTAGNVWLAFNNAWGSGNPASGANPAATFTPATVGALFPAMAFRTVNNGVWTLQSTAASQKYAPPAGFSAWDGGVAPTHSSQAAYLARTVGGNEGGNGENIATLIDGLVADGVWAKLDCLYVLAQQNQTDAALNLIGTSYGLTPLALEKAAPTFTSYVGFNNNGGKIDTGFNSITAPSPHYTTNSASFGAWSYSVVSGSTFALIYDGPTTNLYESYPGLGVLARVNNGSVSGVTTTITKGLIAGDRPDALNVYPYQNGASAGPLAFASATNDNSTFIVGNGTTQILSAAFIGASLGASGQLALYNRLNTYMTAVTPTSVWSAADASTNAMTLSNGGLTFVGTTGAWGAIRNTISKTSGKLYIEFNSSTGSAGNSLLQFGLASSGFNIANYLGSSNYSMGMRPSLDVLVSGFTSNYAPTLSSGGIAEVWALAVDFAVGSVWLARNNVWANSSNPATGSLPAASFVGATVGPLFAAMAVQSPSAGVWTLQATAASQTYAPPSGFSAWG